MRIDSDNAVVYENNGKPRLIIGTDRVFQHIRWNKTSLIVFLDLDRQLSIPEYQAGEEMLHTIENVAFRRHEQSTCIIQTSHPEHLVIRAQKEPDRWYRTELHLRRTLMYPPYRFLVRYCYGHADAALAKSHSTAVYQALESSLTKNNKHDMLHAPIPMQPQYMRGRFWYTILAKIEVQHMQEDLLWLNSQIPANWIIDPHPNSILSL